MDDVGRVLTPAAAPSSEDDSRARQAVWAGAIPTVIQLASEEVTTPESPHPYFVRASRGGIMGAALVLLNASPSR